MSDGNAFMTGVAELDAKMAGMPRAIQMKYGRKSLRNAGKIVRGDYRDRVPIDTGSMRDALRVRATKRKRGQTGIRLVLDRDRLMQLRRARSKEPGSRKKDKEPFFYPAMVELGDGTEKGKRPLTKALYENESKIKAEFIAQLTQLITSGGK